MMENKSKKQLQVYIQYKKNEERIKKIVKSNIQSTITPSIIFDDEVKNKLYKAINSTKNNFSSIIKENTYFTITDGYDFTDTDFSILGIENGTVCNNSDNEYSYSESIIANTKNLSVLKQNYSKLIEQFRKYLDKDWKVFVNFNVVGIGYASAFEAFNSKLGVEMSTHMTPRVDGSADVSLTIKRIKNTAANKG